MWLARLRNEETKLPDWLAMAIFRRGRTAPVWAHMLEGVDTTLTVGARQRDSEFVAEGDEALLHLDALRRPVATSGAKTAVTPLRGLPEKSSLIAGGVQMKSMSAAPSSTSSIEPSTSSLRTSPGSRLTR